MRKKKPTKTGLKVSICGSAHHQDAIKKMAEQFVAMHDLDPKVVMRDMITDMHHFARANKWEWNDLIADANVLYKQEMAKRKGHSIH